MSLLKQLYRPRALTPAWKGLASHCLSNRGTVRTYTSSPVVTGTETKQAVDTTPLRLATDLYAVFRIHNRPYLVTQGDKVILPFRMKQADVGDTLKLTDVTTLGSRNFTLRDDPIDPSLYNLKATVIEKTKRKFETREVTKKRNRRVRHVHSKGDLTVLRINTLEVV